MYLILGLFLLFTRARPYARIDARERKPANTQTQKQNIINKSFLYCDKCFKIKLDKKHFLLLFSRYINKLHTEVVLVFMSIRVINQQLLSILRQNSKQGTKI